MLKSSSSPIPGSGADMPGMSMAWKWLRWLRYWTTRTQASQIVEMLSLRPGLKLLDAGLLVREIFFATASDK